MHHPHHLLASHAPLAQGAPGWAGPATPGGWWPRGLAAAFSRWLGLAALFAAACVAHAATDTFTSAGAASWTAPPGVTSVTVEAWGGGGGGGAANGNPAKGGGGAGGQYAKRVVTVDPGNTYAVVVGAGGTGGSSAAGNAGNDSMFAAATVVAKGGAGGGYAGTNNSGGAGGAGSSTGGVGDIVYAGGSGSNGVSSGTGGAGGGGAGSNGAGGNASGNTAGSGATAGGGAGGAGLTSRNTGNAGNSSGGGGGGGYATNNTNQTGGAGAVGKVVISYTVLPVVTTDDVTNLVVGGATLNGTVTSNEFAVTAVRFEYGPTTAYGSSKAATPATVAQGRTQAVSTTVTSLACGITYHYRAVIVSSRGTTYGDDMTFNGPCPAVLSIDRASTNPAAKNTTVSWTVVFNTSVTGVDATDFVLVPGDGATGASLLSVTGSGATRTVTANTGSAFGTLGLNLVDNDTIVDAAGNRLGGPGAGNGDFTGQVYAVSDPPTLAKVSSTAAAVVGDVVTFTVTATNPYGVALVAVPVVDVLPADMVYATHAATMGTATVAGQTVSWTIPTLVAGASARLTLAVTLTQKGVTTNTVTSGTSSATASVLVLDSAVTHFHLDEPVGTWNGTAGEVIDSGGNNTNGRRRTTSTPSTTNAVSPGTTIASQYPAVIGGFCNAANFDGKAVVEVPRSTAFDYTQSVSASAWVYPTAYPASGGLSTILSNDTNYEFHLTSAGKLNWWWQASEFTSATTVPLNKWTHIAITMDSSAGVRRQRIYINGVPDSNTNNWTGTLTKNTCPFYIGGDISTGSNCTLLPERNFKGMIDEVKLYGYELSQAEVQADMTLGRNCSGTFDHVRIEHNGSGSVCTPENVTVKACLNESCSTLYTGKLTVNLSTSSGSWVGGNALVLTNGVGTIALSNGASGNVTVGTSSSSPIATNATRCFNGGTETCTINFASASCNFDAVEPGANPKTRLFTKLAGANFKVDVLALSGGGLNPGYAGTVNADLVDASTDSCPTGTGLTTAQALTFTASDAGRKNDVVFNYATPMRNVRVRMRVGSSTPACSTDNFAIRPASVTLTPTPAMATAPSATATATTKAGSSFTLRAASTAGYTGTLTLDAAKLTAQTTAQDTSVASGGVVGTLNPATLAVNATPAPTANASYSEVGYVYLAAGAYRDESFTAVDQPSGCAATATCDCVTDASGGGNVSDSLVGSTGRYGCYIGNKAATLGRFIPDHFAISGTAVTAACTGGATSFTYFGQDGFTTAFTLTAQNAANATTQNYAGVFAKLDLSQYASYGFSAAPLPTGSSVASGATAPTGSWVKGVASVSARHQINRPTALTASTNITVSALPTDSDGVTMGAATAVGAATPLRYGRLRLQNRYGSEKLALSVPVQAQYWDGNAFILNTDDSCTAVSVPAAKTLSGSATPDGAANLYFYPVAANKNKLTSTDTTVTMTSPLAAGVSALQFSKPDKAGWLDIILATPSYLQGDWANCMGQSGTAGLRDDLPCARATFGVFKSPLIYRRENY